MRRHYSIPQKIKIVEDFYDSGLSQAAYAAQFGITDRMLRAWITKFNSNKRPKTELIKTQIASAVAIIHKTISKLQEIEKSWEEMIQKDNLGSEDLNKFKDDLKPLLDDSNSLQRLREEVGQQRSTIESDRIVPDKVGKKVKFDWDLE